MNDIRIYMESPFRLMPFMAFETHGQSTPTIILMHFMQDPETLRIKSFAFNAIVRLFHLSPFLSLAPDVLVSDEDELFLTCFLTKSA